MDHHAALAYYLDRAARSRKLCRQAPDPRIAAIHLELAQRYDDLLDSMTGNQEQAPLPALIGSEDKPGAEATAPLNA